MDSIIPGYNPDTPLKKFEVIAGTLGPVKVRFNFCERAGRSKVTKKLQSCRVDEKGRICIVYRESAKCAAFKSQYDQKTIGGAHLRVDIDTLFEAP